jgi:glycyl-tRNA synthetase alpha subunit
MFLRNKSRNKGFKFNANSIMTLLTISRLLSPGSKKKAFEEKERYFGRFNFSLDDVYRVLTYFNKISRDLQQFLYENVRAKYATDISVIYYDVTNYYFEISKQDELRRYGKGPNRIAISLSFRWVWPWIKKVSQSIMNFSLVTSLIKKLSGQ